jgi:hypothetical protein
LMNVEPGSAHLRHSSLMLNHSSPNVEPGSAHLRHGSLNVEPGLAHLRPSLPMTNIFF